MDLLRLRDIGLDCDTFSASLHDPFDHIVGLRLMARIVHGNGGTISGQPSCDSGANPARSAGDDSDLACQGTHNCAAWTRAFSPALSPGDCVHGQRTAPTRPEARCIHAALSNPAQHPAAKAPSEPSKSGLTVIRNTIPRPSPARSPYDSKSAEPSVVADRASIDTSFSVLESTFLRRAIRIPVTNPPINIISRVAPSANGIHKMPLPHFDAKYMPPTSTPRKEGMATMRRR